MEVRRVETDPALYVASLPLAGCVPAGRVSALSVSSSLYGR